LGGVAAKDVGVQSLADLAHHAPAALGSRTAEELQGRAGGPLERSSKGHYEPCHRLPVAVQSVNGVAGRAGNGAVLVGRRQRDEGEEEGELADHVEGERFLGRFDQRVSERNEKKASVEFPLFATKRRYKLK